MERIRRHLSFANCTAGLALLFSMSGGAIAATGGFSSGGTLRACANEEGAIRLLKTGKHCQRGQKTVTWNQTGRAGAKGANGVPGAAGGTGATGTPGSPGSPGNPGSAVAYAHVLQSGVLDAGDSSGVVDAKKYPGFAKGFYCIYGNFTAHVATATADYSEGTGRDVPTQVGLGPEIDKCPSSSTGAPVKAIVLTRDYTTSTGELEDAAFYIVFD
jgi:hypothetical protein